MGLSFLVWIILLLGFGDTAAAPQIMAAIGLAFFLIHFLVLMLLRQNLVAWLGHRSPKSSRATGSQAFSLAVRIGRAIGRSPRLRQLAWLALIAAAIGLLVNKRTGQSG